MAMAVMYMNESVNSRIYSKSTIYKEPSLALQ